MNPKQVNHASNAIGTAAIRALLRIRKREAAAQQETIALVMNGQLQQALARENSPSVDLDSMMAEIDQADN
ncbi:hypothetical protein [Loigolactobacillus bifermentans]|uniref:Uncharacterized protein n=1 Tax=Loigolactobacillus bifermentans DSM 20003 TaxID=1423726 RepID=A0A0R1H8J5_9LACO|nr:hypothetical protein [Loigolactobacillus bifermentans]KRK39239.1 hypothetical protein FC07_GL002487 [Loigolactobacillus bifermentans DSM 20003]QGG61452.1 type II toxin-antitoxin system Phd/YefM family antitoxin [Loigolactobacillus bifermentans]